MAKPLATSKKSVNLATPGGVRVSRIRRDPPPKVEEKYIDPKELERRTVVIGVLAFTLALVVILWGVSTWTGWSPRQYILEL